MVTEQKQTVNNSDLSGCKFPFMNIVIFVNNKCFSLVLKIQNGWSSSSLVLSVPSLSQVAVCVAGGVRVFVSRQQFSDDFRVCVRPHVDV